MRVGTILGIIFALVAAFWLIGLALKIVSAVFHLALGAVVVLVLILWVVFGRKRAA